MTAEALLIRVLKIIPILGLVGLVIQTSGFFASQWRLPETGEKSTAKTVAVGHVR